MHNHLSETLSVNQTLAITTDHGRLLRLPRLVVVDGRIGIARVSLTFVLLLVVGCIRRLLLLFRLLVTLLCCLRDLGVRSGFSEELSLDGVAVHLIARHRVLIAIAIVIYCCFISSLV
jgi:hypothetical protein